MTMELCTECVWEDFRDQLKRFILIRVADESLADDILQEVFIKIHTHLATLNDEQNIKSWTYQITRNTIIDYYRKNLPRIVHPETAIPCCEEIPLNTPHQIITSGLKTLVEELPEKYAQALLLTEFEGFSQKDLARRAGISISGAKSRVQRARQKLKDMLMQCCHFEFDRYGTIVDYHPITCCCCAKYKPPK